MLPRATDGSWISLPSHRENLLTGGQSFRDEDVREEEVIVGSTDLELGERLSVAILIGPSEEVSRLEEVLKSRGVDIPAITRPEAEEILPPYTTGPESDEDFRAHVSAGIRSARRLLRVSFNAPLLHGQSAYWRTIAGEDGKARKSLRTALSLAPEHVPLLRTASRLLTHLESPDEALYWVQRSNQLRKNPWLLSAEISLNTILEQRSKYLRVAREVVTEGNHSAFSLSELRSAMATVEMADGSGRRARQLLRDALIDPTENAVAQAEWVSNAIGSLSGALEPHLRIPNAFEARAIAFANSGKWLESAREALKWASLEPFSTRAYAHGGFVAAVFLRNYALSEEFSRAGLRTQPNDPLLKNNLAFALAGRGQVSEARKVLETGPPPSVDTIEATALRATSGWVEFRDGLTELGDLHYRRALEGITGSGMLDQKATVLAFWAHARVLARLDATEQLVSLGYMRSRVGPETLRTINSLLGPI